jgi:hypothetical protein
MAVNILTIMFYIILLYWDIRLHRVTSLRRQCLKVKCSMDFARYFQTVVHGVGCGDWIESAQDRDRWQALVSTVKNLWFP